MDRFNKQYWATCCLILYLLSPVWAQDLPSLKAGTITQVHGKSTYLPFAPVSKVSEVKEKSNLLTDGSYLTYDNAFLTAQFFDGSWLRMSPRTKLSLEVNPATKTLTIHLFTGSIKVLMSSGLNQGKLQKIFIKSGEGLIETAEAKFSVVRNLLLDNVSIYVEKGLVTISKGDSLQHIHALETVTVDDKSLMILPPKKLNKKELKFLHGAFYLKSKNQSDI